MSIKASNLQINQPPNGDTMPTEQQLDFTSILANSVHDMKNSVSMLIGALDLIFQKTMFVGFLRNATWRMRGFCH
jgi:hypothetical protein